MFPSLSYLVAHLSLLVLALTYEYLLELRGDERGFMRKHKTRIFATPATGHQNKKPTMLLQDLP